MNQKADTYVASRKIALEKKLIEGGEEQSSKFDFMHHRNIPQFFHLKKMLSELLLEDYLRQKLIESGWKDDLKKYCKELIRKKGLEKVTIDELVNELVERGRNTVPNKIKEDLLARIKNYFEDEGY